MSKRHSDLKVRAQFEPNRFSSEFLNKVYEQLKPIGSRILSDERQQEGGAETKATIDDGKK
jgi:hypothetical protein